MFFFFSSFIQTTDYKNINEIFLICPEAALNIQNEYVSISARLRSARKQHMHIHAHTRTHSLQHRGDETTRRSKKIISSVLQCIFLFSDSSAADCRTPQWGLFLVELCEQRSSTITRFYNQMGSFSVSVHYRRSTEEDCQPCSPLQSLFWGGVTIVCRIVYKMTIHKCNRD